METFSCPAGREYEIQVASFLDALTAAGYARHRLTPRRSILLAFSSWAQDEGLAAAALDDGHIASFIAHRAFGRDSRKKVRATLRRFLTHLRRHGVASPPPRPASLVDDLTDRYVAYLRTSRGLAENSILIYAPCVRAFLTHQVETTGRLVLETLDAEAIGSFLVSPGVRRASESARLLSVALRSFLRFLWLRGELTRDLSGAVPRVRTYRQSGVPVVLSPEQVDCVLATADRSTPRGRRDYAILLLLARLGLRASEIVRLELGDVRWRAGEIIVRGKGRRRDHLPLLADVGEAMARYLCEDHETSDSQSVFLRLIPPRIGLAGPCAIDHVVRLALQRAGISPHPRRIAHLFRHSLATRMIRNGASMAEIAEVLRHRSQTTTAIYAKVSFEALRTVARPWPVVGGVR